jgi:coenzyme Q-binding protein COQ10
VTERRITKDVSYSARQMFDLVADVERYPEFLPWCAALRVLERDIQEGEGKLVADMVVVYGVFRETFRSEVLLDSKAKRIDVYYLKGPFKHLHTNWRFEDAPAGGSTVRFDIEFEFRNVVLQAAARAVIEKLFVTMSDAFVARAHEVYGGGVYSIGR